MYTKNFQHIITRNFLSSIPYAWSKLLQWLKFKNLPHDFFCSSLTRAVDKEKRFFGSRAYREIMRNTKRSNIEGFIVKNCKKHNRKIFMSIYFAEQKINHQFHTAQNPFRVLEFFLVNQIHLIWASITFLYYAQDTRDENFFFPHDPRVYCVGWHGWMLEIIWPLELSKCWKIGEIDVGEI